jgi:outer membrane protein OmpA-like peptidoglycan-associated protein
VGCAFPALAQQTAVETSNFPVERLRLSTTREGIIDVESAVIRDHLQWGVGLWLGYARDPLVLTQSTGAGRVGALVADRFGAELQANLALFRWFEVGVELPLVLYQSRPREQPMALQADTVLSNLTSTAVGDVRLLAKARLLRQQDHLINLALMPAVTLPSGGARAYVGDASAVFAPELLLSRDFQQLTVGLNLGAVIRGRTELLNQVVESELASHLGVKYRFYRDGPASGLPLEVMLSLSSAVSAIHPFREANQNHVELRAMAAYDVTPTLQLYLGTGVGLAHGFGTPDYRVFAGVRFGRAPDRDRDGIVDARDQCPDDPEVINGIDDDDGCPDAAPVDPDPDHDGIVGAADKCPDVPETVNGYQDDDGCPDTLPDPDHDGIVGAADKCPNDPEDRDGFQDDDGCPDPDDDGDGVLDTVDSCPRQVGPAANHGCPDPDRDGDGVVDRLDNCPDEPGPPENFGCAKQQLVELTAERIQILQAVYFKTNSDVIEKRSFPLLDNVAAVLRAHPEVKQVRVEGHTDNQGKAAYNLKLSDRRAASVMKYLIGKNIEPSRLSAQGYGDARPISDNKTAVGREKNRRVVFTIIDAAQGVESEGSKRGEP